MLLLWVLFGIINGLVIHFLSSDSRESRIGASIVGGLGGLGGGLMASVLFGQSAIQIAPISLALLLLEGGLLYLLLSGKAFPQKNT